MTRDLYEFTLIILFCFPSGHISGKYMINCFWEFAWIYHIQHIFDFSWTGLLQMPRSKLTPSLGHESTKRIPWTYLNSLAWLLSQEQTKIESQKLVATSVWKYVINGHVRMCRIMEISIYLWLQYEQQILWVKSGLLTKLWSDFMILLLMHPEKQSQ